MSSSYSTQDELLVVRPFHWEKYDQATDTDTVQILAWCHDRNSNPVLLRVEDFPVTCKLELGYVNGRAYHWTADDAVLVVEALAKLLPEEYEPVAPKPGHFSRWRKLYYFGGKYPMMMLVFRNEESMKKASYKVRRPIDVPELGSVKVNMWENDVPTIVKFLVNRHIRHCTWFRVRGERIDGEDSISTLEREYIIDWKTLKKVPKTECAEWYTYPMIMGFDIEQYSDRHEQFPEGSNPRHVVYLNTLTFQRLDSEKRYRYGILYGDCNAIPEDKVKNLTLIKVKHETHIQREMAKLIKKHDPDFLIGYNNQAYDNVRLSERLEIYGKKWPVMGRLKGHYCELITNDWSSSGTGHNSINTLYMPGRIDLDMYHVVKREGYRFRDYQLETVSQVFLKRGKHEMTPRRMFEIFEAMREGMKAGPGTELHTKGMALMTEMLSYCVNDTELVLDLLQALNTWLGSVEMSNAAGVTIADFYTRGQQHRVFSLLYRIATKRGVVLDFKKTLDIPYQGGAVSEPVAGYHRYVIVEDFESLYPSIANAYNLCYTTLVPPRLYHSVPDEDCLILTIDCDEMMRLQEENKGKKRAASLQATKDNSRSKVKTPIVVPAAPKVQYGIKTFKYIKRYDGKEIRGLVPDLANELIEKRRVVKREMETAKGLNKVRLDKKQLALKIINNSIYGFTGAKNGGKRPMVELAMSITYLGRTAIGKCNTYLKDNYGAQIAYGDTDSTMIVMPGINSDDQCAYWGKRFAQELTALFPPRMNMQYEKSITAVFIKKKNYIYTHIDGKGDYKRNADGSLKIEAKGVLSARRDNAKWAVNVYQPMSEICLLQGKIEDVTDKLIDECERLIRGQVPLDDLVITKTMGAVYKSETATMKVFGDELRRIGRPAQVGDRLSYVVTKSKNKDEKLGKRMMLRSMFVELQESPNPPQIDFAYYIGHVLQKHFDNLFTLCFKKEIEFMSGIMFRPNKRCKFTGMKEVCFTIDRMISSSRDLDEAITRLEQLRTAIHEDMSVYRQAENSESTDFIMLDE